MPDLGAASVVGGPLLVALVALVFSILALTLPADLAPREPRRRVNIGIGGIRGQRVHQRVEVAGLNVLPHDRLDVGRFPHAGYSSTSSTISVT